MRLKHQRIHTIDGGSRLAWQSRIPVEHAVRIRASEAGTPPRGWAYFTYPAHFFDENFPPTMRFILCFNAKDGPPFHSTYRNGCQLKKSKNPSAPDKFRLNFDKAEPALDGTESSIRQNVLIANWFPSISDELFNLARTFRENIMNNKFLKEINKAVKLQPPARDKNLVAFLAHRHDIKLALDTGYSGKTVWRQLKSMEIVDFGYETFLNYVKRYLRPPQQPLPHSDAITAKPISSEKTTATPKISKVSSAAGFTINPVPNKDELL